MATGGGEVNSDEIINIKCCFCVKNNRTREAVKYCVECKEYYCIPCTETHQMFPTLAGHKLLDKADFRSTGSDENLLSVPTQRCSQHQSEVTNMYCKGHDQVACPPCIALDHRTCKAILFIPEAVDQLYNRTQMTDMKQKLHKSKTAMQEMKAVNENKLKELQSIFDKEVQSIKAFRQELQTLLDNLEQETIKELKKEFDRIETQLTNEINVADDLIDDIHELSTELKNSEGNKAQEFVSVKFSEKVTTKADDVQKDHQKKAEESFSFLADQNIKSFLQKIQTLGKVSINKTVECIMGQKDGLYKVKHQKRINVKIPSDYHGKLCSIIGSCTIGDGLLLLADYTNHKLKQFDISSETVTDYLDFQASPNAVCLVSKTEAAVTMSNNTVRFVSVGNKLTATHKLTMNHSCYGLAHRDGKLFISDNQRKVYIHDMNGQHLKTISTDASGKEIFGQTAHITISNGGDQVFVADVQKGVVILDIQGNYISTLHPSVSETWGVGTDGRNLFVFGYKPNNIVQLSKDNTLLGEVMKIRWPYSLCFDPHKTRAYVTLSSSNEITLLELE